MFEVGNVLFMLQILVAELIFLYAADRRKGFFWKYPCVFLLCLTLAYFFPMPVEISYGIPYSLFRFFFLIAISVVGMWSCFQLSFRQVFSLCMAGYAVQHISYHCVSIMKRLNLLEWLPTKWMMIGRQNVAELLFFPIIYFLFYACLGRFIAKNEYYKKMDKSFSVIAIVTIIICIVFSRFGRYAQGMGAISVSLYAIACCTLALLVQFVLCKMVELRNENSAIQMLRKEESKQYEISKNNMDLLNVKYHDLKRRLSDYGDRLTKEEINSIKDVLRDYASKIKTGNEALDVLLTDTCRKYQQDGVTLNYAGDGTSLAFMNVSDVYSLFGNAVSNAVEAVLALDNPDQKIIDMILEKKGDMIVVHISNYYQGKIFMEDGLPCTTKKEEQGYHGYGMKSMKLIAEKYGGSLDVQITKDVFSLAISLWQEQPKI